MFDSIDGTAYVHPVHIAVRQAIAELGGATTATNGAVWIEAVRDASADLAAKAAVGELSVEPLRVEGDADPRYVAVQMSRLQLYAVNRRIAEVKSKVQRINPVTNQDEHLQLFGELVSLEQQARALREQASGGL
jgi:DNA primase